MNTRLDKFLKKINSSFSQSFLEKLLRNRHIILNGNRAYSNMLLKDGDVIEYKKFLDIEHSCNTSKNARETIELNSDQISKFSEREFLSKILWRSEELIAIDKSSDVAVQGGSKVKISLQVALDYIKSTQKQDLKIVHRIDKDTSGILLFANGYTNAVKLTKAFKSRLIYKVYLALVENTPRNVEGTIYDYDQYRDSNHNAKSRTSISYYKLLTSNQTKSLLMFIPITGRKHQIRKHALKIGCPIIGDKKYNLRSLGTDLRLHATKIDIDYSVFHKDISISSFPKEEFFENLKIEKSFLIDHIAKFSPKNNYFTKYLN